MEEYGSKLRFLKKSQFNAFNNYINQLTVGFFVWMHRQMVGCMDRQMDGWMDGWIDR